MLKQVLFVGSLGLALCSLNASATGLSCDDLKAKISAKVEGKGVKHYQLDVVDKGTKSALRNVGQCDSGKKIILYSRKAAEASEVKPADATLAKKAETKEK